jgi:hypothetical protein
MTIVNASDTENLTKVKLPRRDWLLLPLLSLLTIGFLAISTQFLARRLLRESSSTTAKCLTLNDPSTGVRGIPNTVCREKAYESGWVEYKFNSCGHRAGFECGTKPNGTYRIVMIGSSFNFGMFVPREKSFAALLPAELESETKRKIELYNESMQWGFPASTALRFKQALDAQPDMILWVLTPTDIGSSSVVLPYLGPPDSSPKEGILAGKLKRVKVAFTTRPLHTAIDVTWNQEIVPSWNRQLDALRGSLSGLLLQHCLYASQSLYVKSYLMGNDSEVGFLKTQPSAEWQSNLRQFDSVAANIEGQAKAASVPFIVSLAPNRAQAAMISMGEWPAEFDPYKLNDELRDITTSHGGTYVDILPDFRRIANPERHYFPVDGHPDADGHAMVSQMLARELTNGAVAGLDVTVTTQPEMEQNR